MSVNSIRNLLEIANEHCPDKVVLIENDQKLTYRRLLQKVNQIAHYFHELGLAPGSRIGLYSNKCSEQVVAILALLSTEYVIVPITRFFKPEQVEYIINDCHIECIITDKTKIKNVLDIDFNGKIVTFEPIDKEHVSFEEIYKCYSDDYHCSISGHNNAVITYSFGSDGSQKGIVITHRNLTDGARIVSKYLDIQENDVLSGILSFNLDYGLNQIFCTLYKRATLAIHKFILPGDFFTHLIRDKVNVIAVMPINLTKMFDEDPHRLPAPQQLKHIRVITSSGGNVTAKMIEDVNQYFSDAKFYSMHGLSEALRSSYLDPAQLHIRPTSIGKAVPDVELYVINEEGKACRPREIGELIHRGACIYRGYWNSPEETNQRFKSIKILENVINLEGELTDEIVVSSGDYVYSDEEGYLYFVDRKDDMIKTSGYRISPFEIEKVVLENIKAISACAVFSVENKEIEEEIVLVYTAPGELPKNEIIFELKKHLPNYMLPSMIIFKSRLPIAASHHGKVDKNVLKKEISEIV